MFKWEQVYPTWQGHWFDLNTYKSSSRSTVVPSSSFALMRHFSFDAEKDFVSFLKLLTNPGNRLTCLTPFLGGFQRHFFQGALVRQKSRASSSTPTTTCLPSESVFLENYVLLNLMKCFYKLYCAPGINPMNGLQACINKIANTYVFQSHFYSLVKINSIIIHFFTFKY